MSTLQRHLVAAPRLARSLSLFDNVKKILGRVKPASPLPSEPQLQSSGELPDQGVTAPAALEKVGSNRKSKVIGFKVDVPQRLAGADFDAGLQSALQKVLGNGKTTISETQKLNLAREIWDQTGSRIPDHVLNSAKKTNDIVSFFAKNQQRGQGRINVLRLDQVKMPDNVKVI